MTIQEARDRTKGMTDRQRSLILSALIGRIEGSEENAGWQADPMAHVLGILDRSIATWENVDLGGKP